MKPLNGLGYRHVNLDGEEAFAYLKGASRWCRERIGTFGISFEVLTEIFSKVEWDKFSTHYQSVCLDIEDSNDHLYYHLNVKTSGIKMHVLTCGYADMDYQKLSLMAAEEISAFDQGLHKENEAEASIRRSRVPSNIGILLDAYFHGDDDIEVGDDYNVSSTIDIDTGLRTLYFTFGHWRGIFNRKLRLFSIVCIQYDPANYV